MHTNLCRLPLGAAGLPGIISMRTGDVTPYVIGMLISFATAFALTLVLAARANKKAEKEVKEMQQATA